MGKPIKERLEALLRRGCTIRLSNGVHWLTSGGGDGMVYFGCGEEGCCDDHYDNVEQFLEYTDYTDADIDEYDLGDGVWHKEAKP